MHSDCGKNGGISTLEAKCSDLYKHTALAQMAHEDHVDLHSPHNNSCIEVASSSEFSDFKADNQSDGLRELDISVEELSNNEELPYYPATEKLRQSGQWAVNEIKSFPGMENTRVHTEEEQRMSQLESDINDMGKFVECTHKGRLDSEVVRETCDGSILEVEATLEVAGFASTERKAANQGEQGHQTHHTKSNEVQGKLQMPSRFFESGLVKTSGEDCIDLQRSENSNQRLVGRDGTPSDPNVCQNQLLLSFQRKEETLQEEKKEIVTALEASEGHLKLRELENCLTQVKDQKVYLEKRCITAETKARESSSLLCQLQTNLDTTTTELFEAKSLNVRVDSMKLQLQRCEEELSHARAQGALAESSRRDLKLREEHIEEVEQGKKVLEERLKWRNEQFQSLEEAHSKLRLQFEEKSSEWDTERSGLVSVIDSLQVTLDSKECILREMQEQLQMVSHALSHEESRRKVLELEAAENRQVLEQATAGYEEAQITLETLREQYSAKKGALDTLGATDWQLQDLQVKYAHMEQEYNELKEIENEHQAWQSNHGEQQQQFLSLKEKMSWVVEAHDSLRSQMKELEKNTENERRDLVKALDQAHDHLGSRDETLKQLDSELDRVKEALDRAQGKCSCLGIQLKQCQSQLEGAYEEAATARDALTSLEKDSRAEKSLLLQSIHEKDKVIQDLKDQIHNMDKTIVELSLQEEERLLIQRDYEELQQRENQREVGRKDLEVSHSSVLQRVRQEENACLADTEKLLAVLQVTEGRASEVQKQLNEAHYRNERYLDVIRKLEARYASHDEEVARHCVLAEQARQQLGVERTEVVKGRREIRTLNESLSAALGDKDLVVGKLKDRIGVLEARLRQKIAETSSHNERVSHLEKDLKEKAEVLLNTEENIALIKSRACETAKELNLSEHVRTNLEEEMKKFQEESLAAKADLERKLEVARRELSVLSLQVKAATRQLLEVGSQKELVLKDLDSKEGFITRMTLENKILMADKDSLQQVVHVLETKEVGLLQEVVDSRTIIVQLVNKSEAAQSNLASRLNEVKALQAELQNVHALGVQLHKAEEQNRGLEGYLKAAKAIAQDKEEKLVASEWAVQQLALDVGKAKAALTQKDREEAVMRDELADVERQLREKEGALIEMECYLEDALLSRESMHRELDRLRQQMEDLNRGAADWKRKEQDMTTQLEVVGAALEEKRAALIACELEIKRGHGLREVMDGAIDSLKLQLAGEQKALSAQQKDMNRLCEDLERSKGESNSATGLVKELRGRLQQLEHSSTVRISQVQSSLSELKEELSLAHHQLEKYQDSTKLLTEESSRYKDKCEALLDLNKRKDSSLKDMEAQLFSVRRSALEQSTLLEQRDRDLKRAKEQLNSQEERRISLQDSFSRIQTQRRELQLDKEKLLAEFRKLRVQLIASSTEVSLKTKEIRSLQIQLEQMKLLAREGGTQVSTIALDGVESSHQAVQECDVRLRAVQASLQEVQEKVQIVQAMLVGKEIDTEMFMEYWSCTEKLSKNIQKGMSKLQEALSLVQSTLSAKSETISLHMCVIDAVGVEIASWKEKAGSNSFKQELLQAASSAAMGSEESAVTMQEALESIQLQLWNTHEFFYSALPEEIQRDLKECKEKSAVAIEKLFALTATSEGAKMKALPYVPLRNLQEALENVEDEVIKYDVLVKNLQAEFATQRVKEVASKEGRHLSRQLKVTQETAELYQQQVCDLQEALEKSSRDLKEKKQQNWCSKPSFSSLQDECLELKSSVAGAEREVVSLTVQLKDVEAKRLQRHEEVLKVNEAMIAMEHDLIEERGNAQRITMLELDLTVEKMKVAESTSLNAGLQVQLEEWKKNADYSEEGKMKQEIVQRLSKLGDNLIDERIKVVESATLISDLQLHVEGWKSKAEDAAKENERVNQELQRVGSTIHSLLSQIETHQAVEQVMKERNDSLHVDMNLAYEVALARKEKMEIFLHELEQSQDGEKELLENLQMEHKRLIIDLGDGGGFDCTVEIDCSQNMHLQGRNAYNIRAAKFATRDDQIRPTFHLQECQISAEDCKLRVQETLEEELEILKLHAKESQRKALELVAKLDAALSNVTTKNLIIEQVNDEMLGLRSLVKQLEQETTTLQTSLHGEEVQQCSTDTSNLTSGRDDQQQSAGPEDWNAAIQEEVNDYLDVCDSLVRKNVRLEKLLDGLQRKNRGLLRQVQDLQMIGKSSSDKECRAMDPVDCDPELVLRGFSRKTNPNVVKPAVRERMVSLKDTCNGKVLGEVDENAVPGSLERWQMSRRPPVSPGAVIQQKKAKRVKDEV